MTAASKITEDIHQYFRIRRIETEEDSFLEYNYKDGTLFLDMQRIQRGNIPGVSTILITLKVRDSEILQKIYSINREGCKGYLTRPRGNSPALPY
ncbi:hypothetical protein ACJMK2_032383 [Sinanodonta woodiana]|uniref:Uncharacterized protein n=1 Tax=Sinanodonta woodiana TaxID=1069815 RepID=A0ABD3X1J0_SINWO